MTSTGHSKKLPLLTRLDGGIKAWTEEKDGGKGAATSTPAGAAKAARGGAAKETASLRMRTAAKQANAVVTGSTHTGDSGPRKLTVATVVIDAAAANQAAVAKVQAIQRGKMERQKTQTLLEEKKAAEAAGLDFWEAKAAATELQAGFRGKMQRQKTATLVEEKRRSLVEESQQRRSEAAAAKVQALQRGKMQRQKTAKLAEAEQVAAQAANAAASAGEANSASKPKQAAIQGQLALPALPDALPVPDADLEAALLGNLKRQPSSGAGLKRQPSGALSARGAAADDFMNRLVEVEAGDSPAATARSGTASGASTARAGGGPAARGGAGALTTAQMILAPKPKGAAGSSTARGGPPGGSSKRLVTPPPSARGGAPGGSTKQLVTPPPTSRGGTAEGVAAKGDEGRSLSEQINERFERSPPKAKTAGGGAKVLRREKSEVGIARVAGGQ